VLKRAPDRGEGNYSLKLLLGVRREGTILLFLESFSPRCEKKKKRNHISPLLKRKRKERILSLILRKGYPPEKKKKKIRRRAHLLSSSRGKKRKKKGKISAPEGEKYEGAHPSTNDLARSPPSKNKRNKRKKIFPSKKKKKKKKSLISAFCVHEKKSPLASKARDEGGGGRRRFLTTLGPGKKKEGAYLPRVREGNPVVWACLKGGVDAPSTICEEGETPPTRRRRGGASLTWLRETRRSYL